MKNGRSIQGHKRVRSAVGYYRQGSHSAPSGGWRIGCICGWDGGVWPTTSTAFPAYRKHVDDVIENHPRMCRRCFTLKTPFEMSAETYSRHICKSCYSKSGNEWQRQHPEESARHKRNHHVYKKFGITLEEAEAMMARQGGVCAICRDTIKDPRGWFPHVDHDHLTGKVRGILCFLCNVGLGQFKDDPARLRAAADYLEQS